MTPEPDLLRTILGEHMPYFVGCSPGHTSTDGHTRPAIEWCPWCGAIASAGDEHLDECPWLVLWRSKDHVDR